MKKIEYAIQPFTEETSLDINKYWGKYGTDKIEAEKTCFSLKGFKQKINNLCIDIKIERFY